MKTILAEIPSGSEYKFTANGHIMKNEKLGSQSDKQSVAREEKQERCIDNTQDDKESRNNHMESTGEKQSSNLKESSAIQCGHPDDSNVNNENCGNEYLVKSSDQGTAIDTTVSFKLSDEEIDDMKLSIAKALKGVIQFDQLGL